MGHRRNGARALVTSLVAGAVLIVAPASPTFAAPPTNDDISNATAVMSVPFTESVNTSDATYAATDTGCGLATVWYEFTPAASGLIEIHTAGSGYDTTLGLHTGDASALNLEQCNDDSVYGLQSQIIAAVDAGVTYYISAGTCCGFGEVGQVGPGGLLVFTVQAAPPPVTSVNVTVQRTATVTRDGLVTVTGTITCDQPAFADIYVTATQRFNRHIVQGGSGTSTACGPDVTGWTLHLASYTGTVFAAGMATADVFAVAYNTSGSADTGMTQTLHVRRGK